MSILDKLLDGVNVEWKPLIEFTNVLRGRRLTRKLLSTDEKHPVFHGGLKPLGFYSKCNRVADTVMIINVGASAGTVGYSAVDFWSSDGCYCIEHSDLLINKFLYYFLNGEEFFLKSKVRVAGIPTLDAFVIEKLKIPIPCPDNPQRSLEIQKEIVRILDSFKEFTIGHTKQCTAELTARNKQFDHYREELFKFEESKVAWNPLDEIGEFQRGKRFVKTDLISAGVPTIHYGEMYTHYGPWADKTISFVSQELVENKNLRVAETGDVVIVAAGETIEDIGQGTAWLGDEGAVIHDACFGYRSPLNPKYVAYFTRTRQFHDQIRKHIRTGKISAINSKGLSKVVIPVPSLEEQERIVSILDRFDMLTKFISAALPKEIELREKQYEYYRDMLITFPKENIEA